MPVAPDLRPSRLGGLLPHALIVAAAVYLVYAGTLKPSQARGRNTHFYYAAGKCWLAGESPYNFRAFSSRLGRTFDLPPQPFVYPPTVSVVCVPLAILPWKVARVVFDCLNFAALAAVCCFSALIVGRAASLDWRSPPIWAWTGVGLLLLSPIVLCIYVAQISLIALAGVLATICCWSTRRPWLGALPLVFASVKPQLSILPFTYMLVAGGLRLLPGLLLAAVVTVATLAITSVSALRADLAESLRGHLALEFNRCENFASLSSLLGRPPLGMGGVRAGTGVAVLLMIRAALCDRPRQPPQVVLSVDSRTASSTLSGLPLMSFALILAAAGLFGPLHDYDLGLYLPLVTMLAVTNWGCRVLLLPGLLLLGRPHLLAALLTHLHAQAGARYIASSLTGTILVFLVSLLLWRNRSAPNGPYIDHFVPIPITLQPDR